MHQKLIYFLLFSVSLISCNESSTKTEPVKHSAKKHSPVRKIDSLSQKNICIDFQIGFDNEPVTIYIDDSLIIKKIMNTQESSGLAYRIIIDRNEGKYIKVNCIFSKMSDSFDIHDLSSFNGLRIDKANKKIVLVKAKTPFLYD
jgi:hypothetical protein